MGNKKEGAIVLIGLLLWIGMLFLLIFLVLLAGRVLTGNWLGILIDERKKMSLSRLQAVLWSVLILSAFLAAAISNLLVVNNPTGALSISIPPELLGILGISATSLIGATLILKAKKPDQVDYNPDSGNPADRPSWSDMFKGDDVANADFVDLSKVQMFCFTIILVLVYGGALAAMFLLANHKHSAIGALPGLNPIIVVLFGISHAGYLAYKAVPRTLPSVSQLAEGQQPAAIPVSTEPSKRDSESSERTPSRKHWYLNGAILALIGTLIALSSLAWAIIQYFLSK